MRGAFLHAKARETALSMLCGQKTLSGRFEHAVFTTEQAALGWLLRPF